MRPRTPFRRVTSSAVFCATYNMCCEHPPSPRQTPHTDEPYHRRERQTGRECAKQDASLARADRRCTTSTSLLVLRCTIAGPRERARELASRSRASEQGSERGSERASKPSVRARERGEGPSNGARATRLNRGKDARSTRRRAETEATYVRRLANRRLRLASVMSAASWALLN